MMAQKHIEVKRRGQYNLFDLLVALIYFERFSNTTLHRKCGYRSSCNTIVFLLLYNFILLITVYDIKFVLLTITILLRHKICKDRKKRLTLLICRIGSTDLF